MAARRGDTLLFERMPVIASHAAVGGKKEGEGPLAAEFDELFPDNNCGQANWETAEKILQLRAARLCLKKAHATEKQVSLVLAGDLQAQCTASSYALRELHLPFVGLFGACSTMAEALGLGATLCSAGLADGLLAMTSSHFCAAERQFRTPLSYGAVRTPTAQWTATAAGCCLLHPAGQGVGIAAATFVFAIILYVAMIFAGVSSLQNMFEAVAESLMHKFPRLSRTAVLVILCVVCLGFGIGMETIDKWGPWMDLVSIYIIPIGATLGAISWFYVMKKDELLDAVNTGSGKLRGNLWYSVGRYVYVPLAVILCCVALFMHVAF